MSATIELVTAGGQVVHRAEFATTRRAIDAQHFIAAHIRGGSTKLFVPGDGGSVGYNVLRGEITDVRLDTATANAETDYHRKHDHQARIAGD